VICAVYGVVAFLDVPLVYQSVKLMPDIHPSSITLAPEMKYTLWAWFVPVTLLMAGLVNGTFRVLRRTRDLESRNAAPASLPQSIKPKFIGEAI
jgi:hypothetical protein